MNKIKDLILVIFVFVLFTGRTQDFSYDKKIGANYSKQIEMMMGIYPDSVLNEYVSAIGLRLVKVLGDPPVDFSFQVVDMAEPNAFALPGGYIYISRGLLSLVNDEAELAGVLGHEMIHVTKRHSVKQMKKSILPGLLHIPGAVVGVFNDELGNLINAPISLGSELFLSNYSRKQESESDELGIKLASQAGYDPWKLAVILNRLSEDAEHLTGEAERKSYFSSHPFTPKRVENIEKEILNLEWSPEKTIVADKISLYTKLDGMVYGQNPDHGIFEETEFKHPVLGFAVTFPEKWNTVNVPVALGATQTDGKAQLIFMIDNSESEPDSLGLKLTNKLQKEYKIKPDKSKSITINGFPAYLVSMTDNSGSETVEMQVYYVKVNDVLLNILGVSSLMFSDTISHTVNSLRLITDDEKREITSLRIRVVTAHEKETLEAFSKRTNNQWNTEITAFKNDIKSDVLLKEGQALKIVVEEPFIN